MSSETIHLSPMDEMDLNIDMSDGLGASAAAPPASSHSTFSDGIDLLLNKKAVGGGHIGSSVKLDDIQSMEDDMNNFSSGGVKFSGVDDAEPMSMFGTADKDIGGGGIGQSTATIHGASKMWDGFGKVDPRMDSEQVPSIPKPNIRNEQIKYWKKISALKKRGIELSKDYGPDSAPEEMKYEYDSIIESQKREASVKFQQNTFTTFVTGLQWAATNWGLANLDGLSDQIAENICDYDEIFEELHEKFGRGGEQHPVVQLIMRLGGSMLMVHMTNQILKNTQMPGLDDMMRQDPEFMRQFQTAALNSMSNTNPGMSNFIRDTNTNNGGGGGGRGNHNHYSGANMNPPSPRQDPRPMPSFNSAPTGGPPAPIKVNSRNAPSPPPDRGGNKISSTSDSNSFRTMRPEMKGPGDLSELLGTHGGTSMRNVRVSNRIDVPDDISAISVQEARDLSGGIQQPKKTTKRKNSGKNTMSLDI